jgi:hypothetical protein
VYMVSKINAGGMRRNSSVDTATGYGLDDQMIGVRFFSSLPRPDRLWGPPSLLSNGYQGGRVVGA